MEQRRGKATQEKPEENRKINPSPFSQHNKRNWNHFIGIETHTIMSKAQQMVQHDHQCPLPHFEPLEKKGGKEIVREKKAGERLGNMVGGK